MKRRKICGIYIIKNKVTGMSYVGQSIDIFKRWREHKNDYKKNNQQKNKVLYKAMRKYGLNNFIFSILEICNEESLSEKEMKWIKELNSYNYGYNETVGGENVGIINKGENHPNHKATEQDVINIRTAYNNNLWYRDVYEIYKDKLGKSTFDKIWKNETWKHLMQEVYTEENLIAHKKECMNIGEENPRSLITNKCLFQIYEWKKQGLTSNEAYKEYLNHKEFNKTEKYLSKSSFQNNWCNIERIIIKLKLIYKMRKKDI